MKAQLISTISVFLIIFFAVQAQTPTDQSAEKLLRKWRCLECHGAANKEFGPRFNDIVSKNKSDSLARSTMADKIRNGSKGNWSEVSHGVPMPAYGTVLSEEEIRKLVDWIMRH